MESIEYKSFTIKVEPDGDPMNPRTEFDNFGKMVCLHCRYDLGDKHDYRSSDFNSWEKIKAAIMSDNNVAIIAPLFLYDHSGLRIKIGNFSGLLPQGRAEFDSVQVGFIFVDKDTIYREWGKTAAAYKKARNYIAGEVETYDDYLSGNVYCYDIEDKDGRGMGSCGGWYGDPKKSGCLDEAKSAIDFHVEKIRKDHIIRVKALIKNNVSLETRSKELCSV